MRVLVTGASGHLARALLPLLAADPAIAEIIALDRHPPILAHPRITPRIADLATTDPTPHLDGIDTLIHLAFVVLQASADRYRTLTESPQPRSDVLQRIARRLSPATRATDRAAMRAINLGATQSLFEAAARAGTRHIVYSSSVAVYGAWPDNPTPIPESHPLRPQPGFAYGEDKAAVESWLDRFTLAQTTPRITRLRLHAIIGPAAQPLVNALATAPLALRLSSTPPPIQCLHEADAASAIIAALHACTGGTYNIAAPTPIPWNAIPRRLTLPLPPAIAEALHRLAWPFTDALGDPGWLAGLRHPLIVDTRKATVELGWHATHNVASAISAARHSATSSARQLTTTSMRNPE